MYYASSVYGLKVGFSTWSAVKGKEKILGRKGNWKKYLQEIGL
jgi:hypothetical protein